MRIGIPLLLAAALAAAIHAEPGSAPVTLPLSGLTADNRDAVAGRLQAIERREFACAEHPGSASDQPGPCAACHRERAERKVPSMAAVQASVEEKSAHLTLAPGRSFRLTEVVAALGDGPAAIDLDRLALEGPVTLRVSGMRCPN